MRKETKSKIKKILTVIGLSALWGASILGVYKYFEWLFTTELVTIVNVTGSYTALVIIAEVLWSALCLGGIDRIIYVKVRECGYCGENVEVPRNLPDDEAVFCSKSCRYKQKEESGW